MPKSCNIFRSLGKAGACFVLLCAAAGCAPPEAEERAPAMPPDEEIMAAFLELDHAWHLRDLEIEGMAAVDDEKARLRQVTRGAHLDATLAAAAAARIVQGEGAHALEAAQFLVEYNEFSVRGTEDLKLGFDALARLIGPDWSLVPQYRRDLAVWQDAVDAIAASESSAREKFLLRWQLGARPKISRACGAALAILESGDHPRLLDAAEFLLLEAGEAPGADLVLSRAATGLSAHFPHYGEWPSILDEMLRVAPPRDEIDAFIRSMAERAADPLIRAQAAEALSRGSRERRDA